MKPSKWSVLLLDPLERQILATCRTLGRSGHDVGVGGPGPPGQAGRSRYASRYHRLPDPCGPATPFGKALEAIIAAHGYEVVVSASDTTLARLGTLRSLSIPSAPVLNTGFDRLTDKFGLAALAAEAEIPYPATFRLQRADEIEDLVGGADIQFPLVLKAERPAVAREDRVSFFRGAKIAHDLPAAVAAFGELSRLGLTPIIQEWVGSDLKVNSVVIRRAGSSELRYAHRVLREDPPSGGIGVTLETISAEVGTGGEAVRLLERACDAAGYDGLAQAELYVRRESGAMYLIDVNPRLWGSTWLAERLGQRVAESLIRRALGLPSLSQAPYPVNRRFHHLKGELSWLRQRKSRLRDAWSLATTTRRRDIIDGVDFSDPVPTVHYVLSRMRDRVTASFARRRRLSGKDDVLGAGSAH